MEMWILGKEDKEAAKIAIHRAGEVIFDNWKTKPTFEIKMTDKNGDFELHMNHADQIGLAQKFIAEKVFMAFLKGVSIGLEHE